MYVDSVVLMIIVVYSLRSKTMECRYAFNRKVGDSIIWFSLSKRAMALFVPQRFP